MITLERVRRGLLRSLGVCVASAFVLSMAPAAQAVSLIGPGTAPATSKAPEGVVTQVRFGGGHGGGGHGGGGFHGGGGGGFRGGAPGFHGGGFRGGGAAFHGGGFRAGPAFHGGGFRASAPYLARRHVYAPVNYGFRRHHFRPRYYGYTDPYYYGSGYYHPRRFCRIVRTHYGLRKICRYRPWVHHHWRRHHRFNVYW